MKFFHDLGDWFGALSPEDAAQALASVTALWSTRAKAPRHLISLEDKLDFVCHDLDPVPMYVGKATNWIEQYRPLIHSAKDLAAAWKHTAAPHPLRLVLPEFMQGLGEKNWLRCLVQRPWDIPYWSDSFLDTTEWLRYLWRTSPKIEYYFPIKAETTRQHWDWPLRVSVDAGAGGRRLFEEVRRHGKEWVDRLIRMVPPDSGEEIDVAFVEPRGSEPAIWPVDMRTPLASIILMAEDSGQKWIKEAPLTISPVVARSAVVALLRPDKKAAAAPIPFVTSWLIEFIRQLSHNMPFVRALFTASRFSQPPVFPIVFADPDNAPKTTLTQTIAPRLEQMPFQADEWVMLDAAVASNLELSPGYKPACWVRARIMDRIRQQPDYFLHERGGATALAALMNAAATGKVRRQAELYEPRWLQARVRDQRSGLQSSVFERAASYRIPVWVGSADPTALRPDTPFPDEKIDWTSDKEKLVLVFTEPAIAREPQVKTVDLPVVGDSSLCEFTLNTDLPEKAGQFPDTIQARIMVLHRNRILQTALLTGPLLGPGQPRGPETIRLTIEAAARPGLAQLSQRREFDAALLVNETIHHEATVTAAAGLTAKLETLTPVQTTIDDMAKDLSEVASQAGEWTMDAGPGLDIFRRLATQGKGLYDALIRDPGWEPMFQNAQLIQMVSVHQQAFLPIELFYDRPAKTTATICPNANKALTSGSCLPDCRPNCATGEVICPLGFWGLQRVIERHVHLRNSKLADTIRPNEFVLQLEPTPAMGSIPLDRGCVHGTSNKVWGYDPSLVAKLEETLTTLTNRKANRVVTWNEWLKHAEPGPSLLVLVPHTDYDLNFKSDSLEIGDEKTADILLLANLTPGHLGSKPPVVVFLIGCETGRPEADFKGFAAQFRRNGAGIVVTTLSKVLGRHAVPVTQHVIKEIFRCCRENGPIALGELLTQLRRKLLADGFILAVGITAYGDADWTLTTTTVPPSGDAECSLSTCSPPATATPSGSNTAMP